MKILAISSSPRRHGNSETLLDAALAGTGDPAATIQKVVLADLRIMPCNGCEACFTTGECVIRDDMQPLYDDLLSCDLLLVASPIYFQGLPCQLKCIIDRCQALWARKYVLKKDIKGFGGLKGQIRHKRCGCAMLVSASSGLKNTFSGAILTLRAWFKTLDIAYEKEFTADGLEENDAALKNRILLARAERFAKKVC